MWQINKKKAELRAVAKISQKQVSKLINEVMVILHHNGFCLISGSLFDA